MVPPHLSPWLEIKKLRPRHQQVNVVLPLMCGCASFLNELKLIKRNGMLRTLLQLASKRLMAFLTSSRGLIRWPQYESPYLESSLVDGCGIWCISTFLGYPTARLKKALSQGSQHSRSSQHSRPTRHRSY